MATRQQIQIALDFVRFANIMNDLLDCSSWILKEIDPNTGAKFQIIKEETGPRDATLDELKSHIHRTIANIRGYRNIIITFVQKYGVNKVREAALKLGIDYDVCKAFLDDVERITNYLETNIGNAQSKPELIPYGEYVDTNIPKLPLIRRSWYL